MPVENNFKKYTRKNPFIYEKNYFHDYFLAMPFLHLKSLLDKNNVNLDNRNLLIASCGCGIDGHYLKKFYSPRKICFTDINPLAMEKTSSNFYNEHLVLSDNLALAFKDNSFDYVFIAEAIHHLKKPIQGLYELLRVSKFGLIVIEPNDSWLTRIFTRLGWASEYEPEHGNYVYRFSKKDVDKTARALFFKYDLVRFFAIHKIAKTKLGFLIIKLLNRLANIVCPQQGNYIVFLIERKQILPKCMVDK